MPKIKTSKSAAKRFKRTATGKIKRRKAYHTHILTKKSAKRKRNLRKQALVSKVEAQKIGRLIPNS